MGTIQPGLSQKSQGLFLAFSQGVKTLKKQIGLIPGTPIWFSS